MFQGHRIVIFAINGAYLPLCSKSHLIDYEKNYDHIKALGIHEIYCLSVNDSFSLRQWGLRLGLQEELINPTSPVNPGNFKKVKLLPDGELQFTRGMGMSCHLTGIGERSCRYSMVLDNGIIEKIFIESAKTIPGGILCEHPVEVSDSDTMIDYLRSLGNHQVFREGMET
jgi:thioredoxin-dependent peroxiredoxin